jgi:hypothetical protein
LLLFDWSQASRGDLALLQHAINADWPITHPNAAALMQATSALFRSAGAAGNDRRVIATARVLVAAERANLREAGIY